MLLRYIMLFATSLIIGLAQPVLANTQDFVFAAKKANADVYLLRGFGNVFSRGLDTMTVKLNKLGVPAKIASFSSWEEVTDQIIENQKKNGKRPIVLIGHSLGANSVLYIAEKLRKKRIRVDYMVTFAATAPPPVPANVRKLTNYYFKTDGWGKPIEKGPGFRGRLKNIDFSKSKTIGHFNIDKQPRLQRQVIRNVLRFVGIKNRVEIHANTPKSNG